VFFVSLEDDLMRLFATERIAGLMDKLGFKEGEVLEHNMLNKSVERAQKKVEENNFGIRKRLLEYDDVMNSQRNVVYTRRKHALMGERIGLDVLNTLYDATTAMVEQYKDSSSYDDFKLELFRTMALETPVDNKDFFDTKTEKLTETVFDEVLKQFKRRMERMAEVAQPVIKQVFETQGSMYENILIPVTDGKRMYNISCNLKEAYNSQSKAIVKSFQKSITLHTIDEAWKEHLREMDELRHSVQNASYENKDPLLIYKLESYNLFKSMVETMNRRTVSILMRGQIPMREDAPQSSSRIQVREAAPERRQDMSRYRTEKDQIGEGGRGGDPLLPKPPVGPQQQRTEPIRAEKHVGRNEPCPCGSGKKYKNCHGKGL
jgi:preprotein translocase subunit SecA